MLSSRGAQNWTDRPMTSIITPPAPIRRACDPVTVDRAGTSHQHHQRPGSRRTPVAAPPRQESRTSRATPHVSPTATHTVTHMPARPRENHSWLIPRAEFVVRSCDLSGLTVESSQSRLPRPLVCTEYCSSSHISGNRDGHVLYITSALCGIKEYQLRSKFCASRPMSLIESCPNLNSDEFCM